ncbi:hypothetical protein [Legionella bononiensis]|uniref:Uncharacterized protein n=1 Tax=Legionella bononiensis TaxID=2793102 RepID=A0ABS1WEA2_9GAMM|nr:hypothetical protein [Legionella bononiensis]MBL7479447.1 hypothetical protein [Legionella bononiensis]MBL7527680.1 hypothetical protein [Legionella bononiensis]
MTQEKYEQDNSQNNPEGNSQLGPDVYESARKLNVQLATRGPAILYALGKATEHVTKNNIVTAVGGMVVGAIGFFGNRYYRNKGDDSAYSYMGQIVGGVQFTAGFLLLAAEAYEIYSSSGDPSPFLDVIKMSGVALSLTESALVLVNSYLYGDSVPKTAAPRPKMS